MNILLTGGRAPATLNLARLFHQAGHTIFIAESIRWHLSRPSRAVAKNFLVPPPNRNPTAYIEALLNIVQQQHINLLIPTCEELFFVAMGREQLQPHCTVFVADIDILKTLHSKWEFIQQTIQYGLSVPHTTLITNLKTAQTLIEQGHSLVLKPVFSRFAAKTIILPRHPQAIAHLDISSQTPWVAQKFINGRQLCTYSISYNGHLTAHVTYPTYFRAGVGATILFKAINHPLTLAWVKDFVQQSNFTGQIAFDFIETNTNEVFALECNPRATSGIHLLSHCPQFPQAFFGYLKTPLTPPTHQSTMLSVPMLLYALPAVRSWSQLKAWGTAFFSSNDVLFSWQDPLPWLLQLRAIFEFLYWSIKYQISPLEASTFDIEWNGETIL